jgi:hypothetical protein
MIYIKGWMQNSTPSFRSENSACFKT